MILRSVLVAVALIVAGCAADKSTTASNGSAMYMCPMHHEMTSSKPGKCAKCGMMMAATQPTTKPAEADHPSSQAEHKH
jgi:hypothetical protein